MSTQVHEMHLVTQRVNGFDVDRNLAKLQSDLAGAKEVLHRILEEAQGCVRYPPRREERCRLASGGSIETRRRSPKSRSNQGGSGAGI